MKRWSALLRVALIVVIGLALLIAGTLLGLRFARRPPPALPVLAGSDRPESCLACHRDVQGLNPAHDPAVLGCSPCHLGDPQAADEAGAHRGMELLPGDLSTIYATCGRGPCHTAEAARVSQSLMARAPGILSVDRFAFGERPSPDGRAEGFADLDAERPPPFASESHARKLCASCHLGVRKRAPGDEGFFARGGGCTACHLAPPYAFGPKTGGRVHPDVTAAVPEKRCTGCHARSGRISLSYDGVVELEPGDPRVNGKLPDGRPTGRLPPDVHRKAGMSCIDCHTERELMGDGTPHRHAHEALEISCADCHAPGPRPPPDPDAARAVTVLRKSWARRHLPALSEGPPLRTRKGTELWRTDADAHSLALVSTGERRTIVPASEAAYHRLRGHERLSCQACHSTWAPRCTSCHTRLDPKGDDVDHLLGKPTPGRWIEEAGGNGFGPPLLAIGPRGSIDPFVEGMTFRLEGVPPGPRERTLWAPLEPHTTGASRPCASCHAESALDAVYPRTGETTRSTARLLDEGERRKIARVGRCLACHPGYDDRIYESYAESLRRLATRRQRPADLALARCGGDPR